MPKTTRVLLGWLDEATAMQLQSTDSRLSGGTRTDSLTAWREFRDRVANLPAREFDAETEPLPEEIADRATAYLHDNAVPVALMGRPVEIRLVDLRKLFAFQPKICIDAVASRVKSQYDKSLNSLFEICLPNEDRLAAVEYNLDARSISLISPNPNFRFRGLTQPQAVPAQGLDGNINGKIAGIGVMAIGYFGTPWVQVTAFGGKLFLSNGYHRCWALLELGATHAIAVVTQASNAMELGAILPGMVAEASLVGNRAPLLIDFQNESLFKMMLEPSIKKVLTFSVTESSVSLELDDSALDSAQERKTA